MSVSWQFRDTNRESRCRTRHIQIRTMYRRTVNKTTWSNPRYNTKLFYFSVWVFETPNERVSIYHQRACEREYFPEYLQRNENWQWINTIISTGNGFDKGLGLGSRKGKYCLRQLEHAFGWNLMSAACPGIHERRNQPNQLDSSVIPSQLVAENHSRNLE